MKNQTLIFPDNIDYQQPGHPALVIDEIEDSESVKYMINQIQKRGFKNPLEGFVTLGEVEKYLFDKIGSINNVDEILDEELVNIFHTIQVWGGKGGRGVYVRSNGFYENFDIRTYRKLVTRCLNLETHRLIDWVNTVTDWTFESHEGINQFSTSFSTKHVRFWLYNKLKEETLPILDEVIQKGFNDIKGNKLSNNQKSLEFYHKQMIEKSKKENISLLKLERLLFNHWRNEKE